jgi:hypothetical protein
MDLGRGCADNGLAARLGNGRARCGIDIDEPPLIPHACPFFNRLWTIQSVRSVSLPHESASHVSRTKQPHLAGKCLIRGRGRLRHDVFWINARFLDNVGPGKVKNRGVSRRHGGLARDGEAQERDETSVDHGYELIMVGLDRVGSSWGRNWYLRLHGRYGLGSKQGMFVFASLRRTKARRAARIEFLLFGSQTVHRLKTCCASAHCCWNPSPAHPT